MNVPSRTRGFTLVEVLIAITLLSIVLAAVLGLVVGSQQEYVRQRDIQKSQESLRAAESVITTVLRSAQADPFVTGSATIDPNPLGHGTWDNLRVTSDHNPADGDFVDPLEDVQLWVAADSLLVRWQSGGSAQLLAFPVESILFSYYSADGTAITTASLVDSLASKVRVVFYTDKGVRSQRDDQLETWVHLRNRP